MSVYYNEHDPQAAAWLRELINAGLIPAGDVDERSIEDVRPDELRGYTQCHFFAGIGGWAYALDLAGWPRDRPVWTGSCPCQPFSSAGARAGFEDERHLWPAMQHLIAQCRPSVVFGEQVASKAADAWIDLVHADLEGMGYAFGCIPFPAAGIGAPHIRDRLYWLGHLHPDLAGLGIGGRVEVRGPRESRPLGAHGSAVGRLADAERLGFRGEGLGAHGAAQAGMQGADGKRQRVWPHLGAGSPFVDGNRAGPVNGMWAAADWLGCRDGKWRPVEPGTFPLAHGLPARVGRLRGYGNAIVPQAAAEFVKAYIEARGVAMTEAANDNALPTPPPHEADRNER